MSIKAKKPLHVIDKIVLVLNVLSVGVLLLSYLAPFANPRSYGFIAIFGFGFQVLLIINVIFILYWIIRRRRYFQLSSIAILLGFRILLANFGLHLPSVLNQTKASPDLIRVMQYNVHNFTGIDEMADKYIQDSVIQIVNSRQPDILNMEEFHAGEADKGAITRAMKKTLNSGYFYYEPFFAQGNDSLGNAIFTKLPIIRRGIVATPSSPGAKAIFADLKFNEKIIRVYCIHLAPVEIEESEKLKYLNGELHLDNFFFIEKRLDSAFKKRSNQVIDIKKHMDECPYPIILTGDFNDTPVSFAVNYLSKGLKNTFIEKGTGPGSTYFSEFPRLHIDYILVSPQFDVLNHEVVKKKLSDHKPLISDLRLK